MMPSIWKMPSHMECVISTYKTLTKIPNVLFAKLDKSGGKIHSRWSIRNIDRGCNTHYTMEFKIDEKFNVLNKSTFGVNISNQLLSADSPSENFKAIIYEDKSGKDNKTFLEVWSNDTLTHSVDLTALDIHGNVYGDSEFGSVDWSPDEKFLVYVAEKKPKKSEPFIKRKPSKDEKEDVDNSDKKIVPGEEHLYKKDWGEQLIGKIQTVVVLCEIEAEKFTILQGLPETWCPGQVCFAPDGEHVIGVAWDVEKYRLGLIYCTNRHSYIFSLNTKTGAYKKLSPDGMSVRSPRLSPAGELVWLQRAAAGPHHAAHRLLRLPSSVINNLDTTEDIQSQVQTVIDIVETSMEISGDTFYGIYCQSLPKKCFSVDGRRLVFSTPQKNEVRSYVVDLDNRTIVDISNNKSEQGSTTVTSVRSGVVLAVCSNLTTPGKLFVAKLPPIGSEQSIQWSYVWGPTLPAKVAEVIKSATVKYLDHEHKASSDDVKSFTSIYMGPSSGTNYPLIVWPHGGPHSAFSNTYFLEAAFYNMLGFALLRINYRGSTGAGDANVRCIMGNVGQYDVKDCLLALNDARERVGYTEKVVLYGGSFGGFTTAHLAGQYPDMFKAVVMRNPVIDMVSKKNYGDNPDGCAVEAGFTYREDGPVTEDQLLALRRCSPLVHVHKVKAPTCLLLGSNDKRVPAYQGLEYGKRLKANGVKTRIHMYEDNHTLGSLPVEMDSLINAADWLITAIKPE
ncbi:acylamino-acid-releasing enzyme-like isoform X2 [Aricia agestis]|uniref:acylamino-acid-releasing enzyme-like isoform X2 n=1 Tax=Aricia agestis TaxID=91739 RepID=UPI001C2082BE|nr:acylamino-acid-releasing enzyme-like isoform X2 [Aricia agestis]